MNQKQREYLSERIRGISQDKRAALKKKHVKESPIQNDTDRLKFIKAGKVKFNKTFQPYLYNSRHSYKLDSVYDFSAYGDQVDKPKYNAALLKLETKIQQTKDLCMLGDCDQAVKLITELEKF